MTWLIALLMLVLQSSDCLSPSSQQSTTSGFSSPTVQRNDIPPPPTTTRRKATARLIFPFVATVGALKFNPPAAVLAFENGIPEMELYREKTKYPGTQPSLGLQKNGKLSICNDGLNCFSTSGDASHRLSTWKPKDGMASEDAMGELLETITAYPPGQARIDKGGFSIITYNAEYMYVQFESMKHGFIDDVEFAINTENKGKGNNVQQVQVRSLSRLGDMDLGVNAKRLNWISAQLRSKGWTAPAITKEDYPDYFPTLVFTYDDYIRSVLSPIDCPVPALPLSCKDPSSLTI